jgi:hypothetical protein
MLWGCGGLTCIILNRTSAANMYGSVQATYADLFLTPPPTGGLASISPRIPDDFVIWA